MSRSAIFYVLRDEDYSEFVKLAHLAPPRKTPPDDKSTKLVVKKAQTVHLSDEQKTSTKIGQFLTKNASSIIEFSWGGAVMDDLLACLQKFQNINLLENRLEIESGQWRCYVVDKETKLKYTEKLVPSKFEEKDMLQMFAQLQEIYEEEILTELKKAGGKVNIKEVKKQLQSQATTLMSEFPERAKAMIEGIKSLHHALSQVDDRSVVLLHIGV